MITHTLGFKIAINPLLFIPFAPSMIMWHLVNGVYCFLPKDSCSSIRPPIHTLFSSPASTLPILSSPRSARIHIMDRRGSSVTLMPRWHTHFNAAWVSSNAASGLKQWCSCKKKGTRVKEATRASFTTAPLTTWDDPLCSHNSPAKQGGTLDS